MLKPATFAITVLILASGATVAETKSQMEKPICGETHCCIQFDTPNGGLAECYEREQSTLTEHEGSPATMP